MEILKGILLLLLVLVCFSLFTFKAPKGETAMSGLAGAAVATFFIEAIFKYILGDFVGVKFLGEVGASAGSMGAPIAAILVAINMGANPIYAVVAGAVVLKLPILSGFFAGYIVGLISKKLEEKIPSGLEVILGAILIAPLSRIIGVITEPAISNTLSTIGEVIKIASEQSPYIMGFLLGGIIKIICTSPLSSMALTAMLNLKGLAMGISAIACFGGAFTNGVVFKRFKIGDKGNLIAVMLEPLTQADLVTKNAFSIYFSDFLGGGLAGIVAAYFNIINNAPGTASPIPGMLAPLAFNPTSKVLISLVLAALCGVLGGLVGTEIIIVYKKIRNNLMKNTNENTEISAS